MLKRSKKIIEISTATFCSALRLEQDILEKMQSGCEGHDGHVCNLGPQLWVSPTHTPNLGTKEFRLECSSVSKMLLSHLDAYVHLKLDCLSVGCGIETNDIK